MELTKMRMVTVVAETVLEEQICATLLKLGASGYTVVESRGHGSLGRQAGEIPGQSVRIETVIDEKIAEELVEGLKRDYFDHYSVACFLSDVFVVRRDKYARKQS